MNIEQTISTLDALGNWTGITARAERDHPALLEAARQADRDLDNGETPAAVQRYFVTWREVFKRCR